jgi:hypothetical protein
MEGRKRGLDGASEAKTLPEAPSSSGSGSSAAAAAAAAAPAAPGAFRGPAADSALGEQMLNVLPLASAVGFACKVSQCLYLCGETFRRGDKGATNDMLVCSIERQSGSRAARAAAREPFFHPGWGTIQGTTQLIRAAILNNLPRVLQLVRLGAPLNLLDLT